MGGLNSGMMSTGKDDWETPPLLFSNLNKKFNFVIDAAANDNNAKTSRYFTEKTNGLTQEWNDTTWVNPPYGRSIIQWVAKAYLESVTNDIVVVMLLPARTDTKWFHDYVMLAHEIWFMRGRIKFVGAKSSAPFPSMIVVFYGREPDVSTPHIFVCDKEGNLLK